MCLCTSEKQSGEFPLQMRNFQAELWHRSKWRCMTTSQPSRLSPRCQLRRQLFHSSRSKGKTLGLWPHWPWFNLNIFSTSFSLLFLPGWRTNHQWKCCSWLSRNETIPSMGPWPKTRFLYIKLPSQSIIAIIIDYVYPGNAGNTLFYRSVISESFSNSRDWKLIIFQILLPFFCHHMWEYENRQET